MDSENSERRTPAASGWRVRRPRLLLGTVVGVVTFVALQALAGLSGRLAFIGAFDVGASVTLLAIYIRFRRSSVAEMKENAIGQDVGQYAVLAFTSIAATVCLVVIASEMPLVKEAATLEKYARALLVVFTIVLAWAFIQTIFAFHYAHDYYLDRPDMKEGDAADRLLFPGKGMPTYSDFLYFSFTIGMTFQVSDVQIADPSIRRVVLTHGIIAFFFTTGILALTINLVAGLI